MPTPPRRRRLEPRRPTNGGGGGWLATIAMGLGVIVAGLGIGALIAVYMQRGASTTPAVVVATATPQTPATATRPPIAMATFEPPRTPRPTPSAKPQPTATPSAEPSRSPSPSPSASLIPSPSPAPDDSPTPAPSPTSRPAVSPTHAPPPTVPAAGTAAASRVAVVTPQPVTERAGSTPSPFAVSPGAAESPAAPVAAEPSSSAYEQHASAIVRRYIGALIRGDETTAYAALGETPGTAPGALTEQGILDPSARIVSIKVTRIDASNASVGCEISAAKGRYYATFHVTAASSGPYIAQHDYIKV